MTRQVIPRDKLGPRTKIGQGGQGVVYRAPNVTTKFAASMVYKEYKTQARTDIDFTALAAMPALVEESMSYAQAERLISIAAWPCALVEDSGTPTGFVMPTIPDEFFIPLTTVKGVSTSTAEFQHLLNHPTVLAARGITVDDAQRYTLLRETASALAFLHKHHVCVGDISPKNLLFSLTPHEAVYFIDCDAMRINTVSALPQVETPGWNAPTGEELATIYTDTYKLGLLALRLLTGDHDTTNPQHLPSTTPALLRQIIIDTLTNPPHQRPLPEAWTYVLGHAIEQAQHQKKLAKAPAPATPTPPAVPVVRSRPSAHSRPPVVPSAPAIPTLHSRPTISPPAPVQSQRWPWLIAAAIVILAVAFVAFEVFKLHPRTSETPTAAPSSQPTVQSAPASAPTAQPAPSSPPPPPTSRYFKTQIGRICEVTAQQVTCQSCIPGERITNAYTCTDPAPGIAVDTAGTIDDNSAAISSYSDIQQLTVGGTEHANGWTIVSNGAWTRFINDSTGHGMAVAAQNRDSF
jgi:eukaryotic-like serine/threonine-protein kinase